MIGCWVKRRITKFMNTTNYDIAVIDQIIKPKFKLSEVSPLLQMFTACLGGEIWVDR